MFGNFEFGLTEDSRVPKPNKIKTLDSSQFESSDYSDGSGSDCLEEFQVAGIPNLNLVTSKEPLKLLDVCEKVHQRHEHSPMRFVRS